LDPAVFIKSAGAYSFAYLYWILHDKSEARFFPSSLGDKMDNQTRKSVQLCLNVAKAFVVFITGSLVVHVMVMALDYYLMIKPLYLNLREDFVISIFSTPMLPMMFAYGLFSLTLYLLWEKKKKALLLAREKEIQSEKVEAVLKSMQRLTGILAEHIAMHNSEIMSWIEFRKRRGRPVSDRVENPNKKIAKALQALSELSFVIPYTQNRPQDVGEIEKMLKDKLYEMTQRQQTEKCSLSLKKYKTAPSEFDSGRLN
jgi:hypothetical protein